MVISLVVLYFIILVVLGYLSSRKAKKTAEDFFLAGRSFNTFLLMMVLLATMLSTFVFTGGPGLVYKTGMGFIGGFFMGNVFLSVFIYFLGKKIWYFGKKYGFITPPELFRDRFESNAVKYVLFLAMLTFILPYLALQPIGGGLILNALSGGDIPYVWGALGITVLTIVYVWMSGQRAVAWNDVFQGFLLLSIMVALAIWMTIKGGGGEGLLQQAPQMVKRGAGTAWTWQATFSWVIIVCVNLMMQPQIFTRYFASKDITSIRKTFVAWPLLSILASIPIAFIGAYGRVLFPDIPNPDQVVPFFIMQYGSPIIIGIVLAGFLAALMSTSSGQILATSSMFTRDLYRSFKKDATERQEYSVGRTMIIFLAFGGFLIGINPPALMATLAQHAFSGFAVLLPAGIAAFYWKRATAAGVVTSIVLGELVILSTAFLPSTFVYGFGFMSVIPGLVLSILSLVLVSLVTQPPSQVTLNKYFAPGSTVTVGNSNTIQQS
jgi:SSS family solute:Na+ symporter